MSPPDTAGPTGREDLLLALDKISEGTIFVDLDGRVTFANAAARAALCADVDPASQMHSGTRLASLLRALEAENAVKDREVFVRDKDGLPGLWLRVTKCGRFGPSGRASGYAIVFRDITDERRAQVGHSHAIEALNASRQRLQAIFDHSLDAILLADDQLRYMDANPAACRLLGYSRDELLQLTVDQVTARDHRRSVADHWAEFLQSGRGAGETILERKDGSCIEVEFRAVAHIIAGVHLSVLRDMTERRRIEANLSDAQRSDSLGLLAGGAAHDLNNLLVGILGNASLALEFPVDRKRTEELLGEILAAGERASHLTRQMLSCVGKTVPYNEQVDLSAMVRELGSLMQSAIPKQVEVQYELAEVPPVDAASGEIQQVVMNLVINAAQSIYEQSPGVIRIRTAVRRIAQPAPEPEISHLPAGDYVVLEVEDTGRGMDRETQARIFDPFFTTKIRGKGLGLVAVRRVVRNHRGGMWVRSQPERGSCFTILFPVSSSQIEEFGGQESRHELTGEGRILIIEEELVVQRMVRSTLERLGYEVVVLSNGRDALSLLPSPQGQFDLILMDLGLPGFAPGELARGIRQIHAAVPIIGSSGFPEPETDRYRSGARIDGFLQKPFTAVTLGKAVKTVLTGSER